MWPLCLLAACLPTGPCRGHTQQHCPSRHGSPSSSVWFRCCVCSQGYLLWNWCWFWHTAPGPHLLFKYHSQGLGGGKKKGKKENEYEIFVAVWRYTHTCTHNTNTPAWLRITGSRGRKTLAKIVFKTTPAAESAEGKPFGPKLVPATCQAGACTDLGWGSRGSPSGTAGAGEPCQPFPGGCSPARLQKTGERVQEMEIPKEAVLVGMGGFFPHNIMESCPRNAHRGGSTCSESGNGDRQHCRLVLAWDKWVPSS